MLLYSLLVSNYWFSNKMTGLNNYKLSHKVIDPNSYINVFLKEIDSVLFSSLVHM